MATTTAIPAQPQKPPAPRIRTNALSEIGYNSITHATDSDAATSGDEADTYTSGNGNDEAGLVGVSIGRAQSRLTSPTTPAAEKAAAIAESGGFFGGAISAVREEPEDLHDTSRDSSPEDVSHRESLATGTGHGHLASNTAVPNPPNTLAQPQHQQTKATWQQPSSKQTSRPRRSTLRNSIASLGDVLSQHKRNSSLGDSLGDMSRRLQDFSLPSMPKTPKFLQNFSATSLLPSFDGTSSSKPEGDTRSDASPSRSGSRKPSPDSSDGRQSRPKIHQRRSTVGEVPVSALSPVNSIGRPSIDGLSLAPSLGDDSRWTDVREQVNSRKKAIADTLDDIHFKPSFSSFSFGPRSRTTSDRASEATNFTTDSGRRAEHAAYPHFYRALEGLEGDIVVLGGYRGSVLKSAGPDARRLWIPLRVTMNLRKVNLDVGLDKEDEITEESRVVPGKMLSHIGPVDISRRLIKRLRDCPNAKAGLLRVHDWGYDWRLSPALTSKKLRDYLVTLLCNQPGVDPSNRGAIVIAHSLGGLITRHAINYRPELFSRVLYAGVPQHAVNILGPMRHGDDVALNSRILTAQVNFTIRTSFALLPVSGQCFYDANTKEELPVDFFDVEHWKDYRWSPVIARPLPSPDLPTSNGRTSIIDSMAERLSSKAVRGAEKADATATGRGAGMTPQMTEGHDEDALADPKDPKLAVTIPYPKAVEYLERTLKETKKFLQELAYKPELEGHYPYHALIYGKNIPTCKGAKVDGRDGIRRSDAYENLLFGSGDGVVLSKAAMLPTGYRSVKKGIILSDKSHVSLLSDLEAVGKCLCALQNAKRHRDESEDLIES